MRTLNKILCMVLVLAMMVGLCAVGASAIKLEDYPDKDSIKNQQAVALLSALGIVEGDERGFRPNDTLIRAEGAAIMTRMFNTKGAGVSSFTDMASAEWAQPYVAYCENQGIIGGYGDGRFGPQDTLTVVQFAKMLVCALGFRADIEGLTGPAWEINVIKLINKIDLCHGLADIDYNAPITRDQAAQMVFNTLTNDMVEYDSLVKVTTGDGTKVEVGANANGVRNIAYDYTNVIDGWMQFIETYFPTVKISATKTRDVFGIPTNYWYRGNDRTDDTWTAGKALCDAPRGDLIKIYDTTIARTTYGTIYTDAELLEATWIDVVENAEPVDAIHVTKGDSAHNLAKYSGATALLIKNAAGNLTLYVKYPYLATVSAVVPATESTSKNREVALKIYGSPDGATTKTCNYETEKFAKRDFVLAYPSGKVGTLADNTPILLVESAEATSGKATAYATRGAAVTGVTIETTKYDFASLGYLGTGAAPTLNKDVTAYLSNGYIMGLIATTSTAADYVFVLGQTTAVKDAFNKYSATVGYLKQDGTTATASLFDAEHVTVAPGWYTMAPKGATVQFNPAVAPFTPKDGTPNEVDSKYVINASTPQIAAGIAANNNTTFVVKSGKAGTYAAYTGVKSLPTFSVKKADFPEAHVYALINDKTGVADVVYIDMNGATATDAAATPIYLVSNSSTSTRIVDGVTYHTYSVIMDGKLTTIQDYNGGIGTATEGLIVPHFNADGYLTDCEPATTNVTANCVYQTSSDVKFAGGVLTYSDGSVMVNGDAAVYVYNLKVNPFALISGADAEYLVGKAGNLSLVRVSAGNTAIKEIYFIVK